MPVGRGGEGHAKYLGRELNHGPIASATSFLMGAALDAFILVVYINCLFACLFVFSVFKNMKSHDVLRRACISGHTKNWNQIQRIRTAS